MHDVNWKRPTWDCDDLGPDKVLGKPCRINRGRCDDYPQFWPLLKESMQTAEQEVDIDASLVRLVEDNRVIPLKFGVTG